MLLLWAGSCLVVITEHAPGSIVPSFCSKQQEGRTQRIICVKDVKIIVACTMLLLSRVEPRILRLCSLRLQRLFMYLDM